jgi:hypothetical protein
MNKRFKGSGFDERIIGYVENCIDCGNKFFQINIPAIGENADTIIN